MSEDSSSDGDIFYDDIYSEEEDEFPESLTVVYNRFFINIRIKKEIWKNLINFDSHTSNEDKIKTLNILSDILYRAERSDLIEDFTIRERRPTNISSLVQEYTTISEIYRNLLDLIRNSNTHIKIAAARLLSFSFFIQRAADDAVSSSSSSNIQTPSLKLNEITDLIMNPCYPLRVQATGLTIAIPQQSSHPIKILHSHLTHRLSLHLLFRIVGVLKEKRNCDLSLSTLEENLENFKPVKDFPLLNKMVNDLKTWHNSHRQLLLNKSCEEISIEILTEGEEKKKKPKNNSSNNNNDNNNSNKDDKSDKNKEVSKWKHNMLVQIISGEKAGLTGSLMGFTSTEGVVGLTNSTEIIQIPLDHLKPMEDSNNKEVSHIQADPELYNPDYHELSFNNTFDNEFLNLLNIYSKINITNEIYSLMKNNNNSSNNLFELLIHYLLITNDLYTIKYILRMISNMIRQTQCISDFVLQYHGLSIVLFFQHVCMKYPSICESIIEMYVYLTTVDSMKYLLDSDDSIKQNLINFMLYVFKTLPKHLVIISVVLDLIGNIVKYDSFKSKLDETEGMRDIMDAYVPYLGRELRDIEDEEFDVFIEPLLRVVAVYINVEVILRGKDLAMKVFGNINNVPYEYKNVLFNNNNFPDVESALDIVMKLIYYYPKEAYEIYDSTNWGKIKTLFIDTNYMKYVLEYPSDDINATDKELLDMINISTSFLISPSNYKFVLNGNSELINIVFDHFENPKFNDLGSLVYFLYHLLKETHKSSCYLFRYQQLSEIQKVTSNTQLHCTCDLHWEDEMKTQMRYQIRDYQGFAKLKDLFKSCNNGTTLLSPIHYYLTTILLGLCRESQVRMFFKISIKPLVHTLLYTAKSNIDYNNIYSILYHNSLFELEYRLSDEFENDMKNKQYKSINKNQINFDKKELLYLIYDHLSSNGLKETASKLLEEGNIQSLVSETSQSSSQSSSSSSSSQQQSNNKNDNKTIKLIGLKPSPMKRPFSSVSSNNNTNSTFATPTTSKKRRISEINNNNQQQQAPPPTPINTIPLNNNYNSNNKTRLEELVTDYLYDEHMKCPNTGSLLPKFSLLVPHKCNSNQIQSNCPINITSRLLSFETSTVCSLPYRYKNLNNKYFYSELNTKKDWMFNDKAYSDFCFIDNRHVLCSTYDAECFLFDVTNHNYSYEIVLQGVSGSITNIQSNFAKNFILVTTDEPTILYSVKSSTEYEIVKSFDNVDAVGFSHYSNELICYSEDNNTRERNSSNSNGEYYGEVKIYDIDSDKMSYIYECPKNLSDAFDYDDKKKLILVDGVAIDIRSNKIVLDAYQLEDNCSSNSNLIHPYKPEVIVNDYVWDLRKNCPFKQIPQFYDMAMYEFNDAGDMILCYSCMDIRHLDKDSVNKKNNYFSLLDSDSYNIVKQKGPLKSNIVCCHFHPEDLCIPYITGTINSDKNTFEYYSVGEVYMEDTNGYSDSDVDSDSDSDLDSDISELEDLM